MTITTTIASDAPDPAVEMAAQYHQFLADTVGADDDTLSALCREVRDPLEVRMIETRPTTMEGIAATLSVALYELGEHMVGCGSPTVDKLVVGIIENCIKAGEPVTTA